MRWMSYIALPSAHTRPHAGMPLLSPFEGGVQRAGRGTRRVWRRNATYTGGYIPLDPPSKGDKKHLHLLIGVLTLLACGIAQAQDSVRIHAELDPAEIPYHRTATYRVVVEAPDGVDVPAPELKDIFDGLDLKAVGPAYEPLPEGGERATYAWTFDPIEVRTYTIPAISMAWEGGAVTLPPVALKVRELTAAEEDAAAIFEEIAAPETLAPKPVPYAWIAGGLLAALAVLAALVWYLRRKPVEAPKRIRPPWEVARLRLKELKRRELPEHGKYGAFYVDLSAILRYYIEDRFQLHAPEQTTPEFLEAAGASGALSEAQQEALAAFLRHCDRVKFARYEPSLEEMAQSFETVDRFVGETIPRANTTAPAEAA